MGCLLLCGERRGLCGSFMLQHVSHTVTSRTMQGILRDDLFRLGEGPKMYGSYFISRNRSECMLMTILGFAPLQV